MSGGVIFTVEFACSWPGCDEYLSAGWDTPKRLSARARRYAVGMGWSWTRRGGRSVARCPAHRGLRL